MINSAQKSTILLACLGLNTNKQIIKDITIKDIVLLFGEEDNIRKILIFSRKKVLKAFIEFESFEAAEKMKIRYHNQFAGVYGKVRLYFSPLKEVKEESNSTDFKDFIRGNQENSLFKITKNSLDKGIKEGKDFCVNENINKSNQKQITEKKEILLYSNDFEKKEFDNESLFKKENGNENYLKDNCRTEESFYKNNNNSSNNNSDVNFVYPSKVICVSNISPVFKSAREILNLIGAFGIVKKIIYINDQKKAFIEFQSVIYATECITYLCGLNVFGFDLKVSFSRYKKLAFSEVGESFSSHDCLEVGIEQNRYSLYHPVEIKPVSSELLLVIPKTSDIQYIDIFMTIYDICKIKSSNLRKVARVSKEDSFFYFSAEFSNFEEALYVMVKFHSRKVKEKEVRIYFL